MELLLFGGTAEGRLLAEWLRDRGTPVTLCVATEYGGALAPAGGGVTVRTGRMDVSGMEALMDSRPYACAVDATHPYAVEASRNIRAACGAAGLPYRRLIRRETERGDGWLHAASACAAADLAQSLEGNLLLTTGSKELDAFARPGLRERCCPRVLPALDSLRRCLELGFPQRQIICMQGPFSKELNLAMLDTFEIRTLVTKATGAAGGFLEKAEAARARGCNLLVIDRPAEESGLTLEEMKRFLEEGTA